MKKTIIPIKGMHCRSCEILIEDGLKNISGVRKAEVSHKNACACIYHEGNIKTQDIHQAIAKAGYQVGLSDKLPIVSKNPGDWVDILFSFVAIFFLYILLDILGFTKIIASDFGNPSNLIAVFIIGLTAGVSTCMALVGGLVLGVSVRYAKTHPESSFFSRFQPHLFFSLGRITSYFFLGGLLGAFGSFFRLSGISLGLITIAVAFIMLLLGLQLTGLFPRLSNGFFTLPKGLSRLLGIRNHTESKYSHKNALILGGLTFFLPCGFTQAMQLLAIGSGNFATGASIMAAFALGTAPGLLGIGGLTSIVKGEIARKFFRFAGSIVILLAIFNLNNGFNLVGISPLLFLGTGNTTNSNNNTVIIKDNLQTIKMLQTGRGYEPNSFTVVKGIPVRWVIESKEPFSCASFLVVPKLNITKNLQKGENIIEFTPTEVGRIPFSCSMGMYNGIFNVVEKDNLGTNKTTDDIQNQVLAVDNIADVPTPSGNGMGCGVGCAGCGKKRI